MPNPHRARAGRLAPAGLLACALLPLLGRPGHALQGDLDAIWNDPAFQRQFVAGYGINAEVEPRLTSDEIAVLEKVRPLMADNLPKAEETLRKQMKADCSATLDFTLGAIQFQQDKVRESLANYQRAVEKFPSFRRAWRNLGLIHAKNGEPDAAIRAFTRMMELGGSDAYSFGLLGIAYFQKKDYQAAEVAFRNALLLQPDNAEWRLNLTNCVLKQERFEDAASLLDVLIERYPAKHEFWVLQASAYVGLKQPLRAAQNLEAVDRLGKSTTDGLHWLGDLYASENLMELAAGAYARAIELDAEQPPARALRAVEVLAARRANEQARALAKRVHERWDARLDEADRRRLLKLEVRLTMAEGGGTSESAKVLEEIVALDPLDGDALLLLGEHYARASEPDRAMLYYERAEEIAAFEATAKIRHARVLLQLGRFNDALPLLRRAQEIKPREDIARTIEQVERNARARR